MFVRTFYRVPQRALTGARAVFLTMTMPKGDLPFFSQFSTF
jgi:predicted membrane GTPase involved in stress response